MRALILLCAMAVGAATHAQAPTIDVRVDPRVELMSVIFRLAGHPEYNQGKVDVYTESVEAHFADFRDHAVVRRAKQLRRDHGVSYDAVMSMAVHMTDTETLGEAVPFTADGSLESRWKPEDARAFLDDAREFVAETDFAGFLDDHQSLYQTTAARMQSVLDQHAELSWFDGFFGSRPTAEFELALGLLNGGQCYGPSVRHPDGREDLHCVLGVWKVDAEGQPAFDASVLSTVVHEFCHSYCNRLVDAHADALAPAAEEIWPHVEDVMRRQAYGRWQVMLYESLVRACVVRYRAHVDGDAGRREQIESEHRRGFVWTGVLSDLLAEYERDRETYPTLAAFMPKITAFFAEYAETFTAERSAAPTVVSMTPANGADGVDPQTSAIVITFDRPMLDKAWSFVGGGPNFPEVAGQPSYDESRTVLTLPVKLKPSWSYEFWLNRAQFQSFQSEDRVPLQPVHVQFSTGQDQ